MAAEETPSIESLQRNLGVTFRDTSLLEEALVHSSYKNENPAFPYSSNERMEFLGDAVLSLVVAEQLYSEFPELDEGKLSQIRAALVKMETLAEVADRLGLGPFLLLGQGEESGGGRGRPSNLARAFEALLGAIFLDQGMSKARDFALKALGEKWATAAGGEGTDYKSRLQERVQARQQPPPIYRLVETSGPDHARLFTVEVMVEDIVMAQGRGRSKKTAEREAARLAMEKLGQEDALRKVKLSGKR